MSHSFDNEIFPEIRQGGFLHLCEALEHAARSDSALTFFDGTGKIKASLTYRTLLEKAHAGAAYLQSKGLREGDRLVLVADTSSEFIIAFFACQYIGVIPCPIPPLTHAGDLTTARRLLGGWMMNAQTRWIACSTSMAMMVNMATKEIQALSLGKIAAAPHRPYNVILPTSGSVAYVQFSSGSTSFPKGIIVTQQALMTNVDDIARFGLQVTQEDRGFNWLPLHHDMGMVGFCIVPMCCQRPVDYIEPHVFAGNPGLWIELMSQRRSTIVFAPSFAWGMAADRMGNTKKVDLSALRIAGIGGDLIKHADLDRFCDRFSASGFRRESFIPCYGLAEATLAVSISPMGSLEAIPDHADRSSDQRVACGPPLPSVEISIRDHLGQPVPDGVHGHLWIRGKSVATTSLTGWLPLDADGFLDTGDVASLQHGGLCISGRSKELIIIRGRNIWPQDVEELFLSITALPATRVCCFGIEKEGIERIFLLVQGEKDLDAVLVQEAREQITMTFGSAPTLLVVPDNSLPFTTSGKLSRQRARNRYLNGKITPLRAPSLESHHE